MWRAKVLHSTNKAQEKETPRAVNRSETEDDKRQNLSLPSFCFQAPCQDATAVEEKSKDASRAYSSGRTSSYPPQKLLPLRGYYHCESGEKIMVIRD